MSSNTPVPAHELDLPGVADVTGDRAAGIVRVGHAGDRSPQQVAGLRSRRRSGRVIVAAPDRIVVEPGHQRHRLIGELQPLDMGEAIRSVERPALLSVTVTTSSVKSSRAVVVDVIV